ncbi:MAG: hypothetical protein C4555_06420 [Dehalococcoidia bacterium]|nr:MAG: hypothetical protein C4555_06420 [Dehalococcoidia bacterium]
MEKITSETFRPIRLILKQYFHNHSVKIVREELPVDRYRPTMAYRPLDDQINIHPRVTPHRLDVPDYYWRLVHEVIHSTGHPSRLGRPSIESFTSAFFGPSEEEYIGEELFTEHVNRLIFQYFGLEEAVAPFQLPYMAVWELRRRDMGLALPKEADVRRTVGYLLTGGKQ